VPSGPRQGCQLEKDLCELQPNQQTGKKNLGEEIPMALPAWFSARSPFRSKGHTVNCAPSCVAWSPLNPNPQNWLFPLTTKGLARPGVPAIHKELPPRSDLPKAPNRTMGNFLAGAKGLKSKRKTTTRKNQLHCIGFAIAIAMACNQTLPKHGAPHTKHNTTEGGR